MDFQKVLDAEGILNAARDRILERRLTKVQQLHAQVPMEKMNREAGVIEGMDIAANTIRTILLEARREKAKLVKEVRGDA